MTVSHPIVAAMGLPPSHTHARTHARTHTHRHTHTPLQERPEESNDIPCLPSLNDIVGRRDQLETLQRELPEVAQSPQSWRQLDDVIVAEIQAVEGHHVTDAVRDAAEEVVRQEKSCQERTH